MTASTIDWDAVHAAGLKLVGEPLAIDLANTQKLAVTPPRELLPDDAAQRAFWGFQTDRIAVPDTLPTLDAVRELRSAIHSLLESRIDGTLAEEWARDIVNRVAAASPVTAQLTGGWLSDVAPSTADDAAHLLGAVARSAIDVLTGPDAGRLHRCAADDCSMVFIATNSKRQWCTAAGCGNRQRVARHASKARTKGSAA